MKQQRGQTIRFCFYCGVFLVFALSGLGADSIKRNSVVAEPSAINKNTLVHPLDAKLREVNFTQIRMSEAVRKVTDAVNNAYGRGVLLSIGIEHVDDNKLRDPRVSLNARDLSARDVFTQLCAQTGWTYTWTLKRNVMFRDGPPRLPEYTETTQPKIPDERNALSIAQGAINKRDPSVKPIRYTIEAFNTGWLITAPYWRNHEFFDPAGTGDAWITLFVTRERKVFSYEKTH